MGRGFSADIQPPYLPSEHTVPVYPIFITVTYAIFGENNFAVRLAQAAVDTITCMLVSFLAFSLAPQRLRDYAALSSLMIYGFFSWFTLFWTRYILTETLAIFLTTATVSLAVWSLRRGGWSWLLVGLACGLTILTRADSVFLAFAFCLFFFFQASKNWAGAIAGLALFCAGIAFVLTPWTIRNYRAFAKFQPLANPYGKPRGEYVPTGYLLWVRTWMTDETNYHVTDLVFHPGNRDFDPGKLPAYAFDSEEERLEISELIGQYNRTGEMTPDLSETFRAIAQSRIERSPLRFYVWLPIRRVVSMWLTGFVTDNRLHMYVRILSVLPLLIGGAFGFVYWIRGHLLLLVLLVIGVRTAAFAFIGMEARFVVELYPFVIAACGITVAAVLHRYALAART